MLALCLFVVLAALFITVAYGQNTGTSGGIGGQVLNHLSKFSTDNFLANTPSSPEPVEQG